MTPRESAASEASDIDSALAAADAAQNEAEVLAELWRLTGFDPAQRPPRRFWQRAVWTRAHADALEGRAPRVPAEHALWFYLDAPDQGCGVSPFA